MTNGAESELVQLHFCVHNLHARHVGWAKRMFHPFVLYAGYEHFVALQLPELRKLLVLFVECVGPIQMMCIVPAPHRVYIALAWALALLLGHRLPLVSDTDSVWNLLHAQCYPVFCRNTALRVNESNPLRRVRHGSKEFLCVGVVALC